MKLLKPLDITNKKKGKKRRNRKIVRRRGFFYKLTRKGRVGKKKKKRDKEIKRRKNFLPSLILTILFWLFTFYIIYFIDPLEQGAVRLFFFSIFLSLMFTLSLMFSNTRRGLLLTFSIIFFLVLRYFGIGNIINIFLIVGLTITAETYFSKKQY